MRQITPIRGRHDLRGNTTSVIVVLPPSPVGKEKERKTVPDLTPQTPIINKQTYASPLSYIGATRRIAAWARGDRSTWAAVAVWTAAVIAMLSAWAFVTVWYVIIFGLFGVVTFPYRLMRRSQRKALHTQQVQLATMQAMMVGQQRQIADQAAREQAAPKAAELEEPARAERMTDAREPVGRAQMNLAA